VVLLSCVLRGLVSEARVEQGQRVGSPATEREWYLPVQTTHVQC
jgi:hypothetical protein